MAVVKFTSLIPEYADILDVFSNAREDLGKHSKTSAIYTDSNSSNQLIFEGSNFKYNGEKITSGHLDTLRFTNADGEDYFTVKKVDADLKDLTGALTGKSLIAVLNMLFEGNDKWIGGDVTEYIFAGKGNDRLFGGIGDDELDGGKGKDKLTGGAGEDGFDLYRGTGEDIVTDFHSEGGDGVQDYVVLWTENYKITGDETPTVVSVGKGNKLTLQGVDVATFDVDDLYFVT